MSELLGLETSKNLLRNGDFSRHSVSITNVTNIACWAPSVTDLSVSDANVIAPEAGDPPVEVLLKVTPSAESITQEIIQPEWIYPATKSFAVTVALGAWSGNSVTLTGFTADMLSVSLSWGGTARVAEMKVGDLVQFVGATVGGSITAEDTGMYRVTDINTVTPSITIQAVDFTPGVKADNAPAVLVRTLEAFSLTYTARWLQQTGDTSIPTLQGVLLDTPGGTPFSINQVGTTKSVNITSVTGWDLKAALFSRETPISPQKLNFTLTANTGAAANKIGDVALYVGNHISEDDSDLDFIPFSTDQANFLDIRGALHFFNRTVQAASAFKALDYELELGTGTVFNSPTDNGSLIIPAADFTGAYNSSENETTLTITNTPAIMTDDRFIIGGGLAVRVTESVSGFVTSWPVKDIFINETLNTSRIILSGDLTDIWGSPTPAEDLRIVQRAFISYDTSNSVVFRVNGDDASEPGAGPLIESRDSFRIITPTISRAYNIVNASATGNGTPLTGATSIDFVLGPYTKTAAAAFIASKLELGPGFSATALPGGFIVITADEGPISITVATSNPGAMTPAGLGAPVGSFFEDINMDVFDKSNDIVSMDADGLSVGDIIEIVEVIDATLNEHDAGYYPTAPAGGNIEPPIFVKVKSVQRGSAALASPTPGASIESGSDLVGLSQLDGSAINSVYTSWFDHNCGTTGFERDNVYKVHKRTLGHEHITVSDSSVDVRGDDAKKNNRRPGSGHSHALAREDLPAHFRTAIAERL